MAENIYLLEHNDTDLKDTSTVIIQSCKQYDDITLDLSLYNNGNILDLTQYTIDLRVLKPDNTFVIQTNNIIKTTNNVKIECMRDITRVSGKVKCELRLVNSETKQKTSFDFIIPIKPSVINENSVESGNIVSIIEELNKTIDTGNALDDTLKEDITIGTQLDMTLDEDVRVGTILKHSLIEKMEEGYYLDDVLEATTTNANNKKIELEGTISTANTSQTELENTTAIADAKKTELDTSIANAQDDINTINARGNDSYIVLSDNWVGTEPNLTYVLNHGLNSKNLIVGAINDDTKFSSMPDFKYIDMNTIELQSTTRSNITVSINANYYSGKDANTIAQEVIDARDGQVSLKSKIDKMDLTINNNINSIASVGSNISYVFDWIEAITDNITFKTIIPYPNGCIKGECYVIGGYITKIDNSYDSILNDGVNIYYQDEGIAIIVNSTTYQGKIARLLIAKEL